MIEPVAEALGNTVAISRKSYVHPALVEAAKERPRDPLPGIERPRGAQMAVVGRGRAARIPQAPIAAAPETGESRLSLAAIKDLQNLMPAFDPKRSLRSAVMHNVRRRLSPVSSE